MFHLWKMTEAAAYLGVRPGTLYGWVRLGRIPHIEQDGLVLFWRADLEARFESLGSVQANPATLLSQPHVVGRPP
jgi:excisionase family DNA binding protein